VATTLNPIDSLYARLNAAGISTGFARKVLPAWWDNAVALTPSGLQQAQMYFARSFNIDLASLAQPKGELQFLGAERKFKLSRNVTQADVFVSAHYVTAMAKLALHGFKKTQTTVPLDPVALRTALLRQNDCVSLAALLAWCAEAGIPVLHIDKLPGKKMTGLVVREDDRFAIVLSKKGTPAHHLFHLAHELGHIGHGHLKSNGFVADQSIGGADTGDADEKEADAYAIRLLNGSEATYSSDTVLRSGAELYRAALTMATREKIDVGHIILNYGNAQNAHPLAAVALKSIKGESDGAKVVNQAFFKAINTAALSEDQLDLITTAVANSASL
jgi:Zn-dependent peptidase ImmA (M78 family)